MIIALHGDYARAEMLERDMGDLSCSVDLFYDANGWIRFNKRLSKLLEMLTRLSEPPIMIGYSGGGAAIAVISRRIAMKAAVLYESPVLDSEGVGGTFPVLMIWNNHGAKFSRSATRRQQAIYSEEIWSQNHPVTNLMGTGGHIRRKPLGHYWDTSLNDQIRDWLVNYDSAVGCNYLSD
jgi:hypothetical protein